MAEKKLNGEKVSARKGASSWDCSSRGLWLAELVLSKQELPRQRLSWEGIHSGGVLSDENGPSQDSRDSLTFGLSGPSLSMDEWGGCLSVTSPLLVMP